MNFYFFGTNVSQKNWARGEVRDAGFEKMATFLITFTCGFNFVVGTVNWVDSTHLKIVISY